MTQRLLQAAKAFWTASLLCMPWRGDDDLQWEELLAGGALGLPSCPFSTMHVHVGQMPLSVHLPCAATLQMRNLLGPACCSHTMHSGVPASASLDLANWRAGGSPGDACAMVAKWFCIDSPSSSISSCMGIASCGTSGNGNAAPLGSALNPGRLSGPVAIAPLLANLLQFAG